jgi:hypothetical protein
MKWFNNGGKSVIELLVSDDGQVVNGAFIKKHANGLFASYGTGMDEDMEFPEDQINEAKAWVEAQYMLTKGTADAV